MPTKVLLVDDHELIRQGLSSAFARAADFTVVAEAGTVADAEQKATDLSPDVVITDIRLPDGSGLDLARRLRRARPAVGIVVLTMYAGDEKLLAALEAGASAFVHKDVSGEDVVAAARHAARAPSSFTAPDLAAVVRRSGNPSLRQLSARENEVLQLLSEGLGVTELARQLYISSSTAKTHIANIYDKLGASNRAQAIMSALQRGIIHGVSDTYV